MERKIGLFRSFPAVVLGTTPNSRSLPNSPSDPQRHVHNSIVAMIVEAKYDHNGNPEFDAADFKEMEARARGPDVLTPQEEAMVVEAKEQGNEHFKAGRVEEALGSYHRALTVFSDRKAGPEQRLEKSKLMANRAECQPTGVHGGRPPRRCSNAARRCEREGALPTARARALSSAASPI